MSDYVLSCSSPADMTPEYYEKRDIRMISFHFMLGSEWYMDDCGKTIPYDEFYARMAKGEMTKTSQINAEEYEEYFENILKEGLDILHLSLSSGISGTYNSARIAMETLKDKYPDRKIIVEDSLAASSGFGLLMDKLADLRDEGKSLEEVAAFARDNKRRLNHWFFTTDLTYLIRGGRVSKASGMIGQAFNICPLLNVDLDGKLVARSKHRGKKRVIRAAADKVLSLIEDRENYTGKIFISNANCPEDAREVSDILEAALPKMDGPVRHFSIGNLIGSHTGPGTVAIFFWGDERVD